MSNQGDQPLARVSYMALIDDMCEAARRHRRASAKGRSGYIVFIWVYIFLMILTLLSIQQVGLARVISNAVWFAAIVLVLLPVAGKLLIKISTRKSIITMYGSDGPQPVTFELREGYLRYEISGVDVRVRWSNVVGVEEDDDYIQLTIKPTSVALIAKRAFSSPDEVEHFLSVAQELHQSAPAPQATHPPTMPPTATI